MKLVCVSTPELIVPLTPEGNTMILLGTSPAGTAISGTVVPTIDNTMSVDNFPVCVGIKVELEYYPSGSTTASYEDIIINPSSVNTTINNNHIILKNDNGIGKKSGITATVISCGQTSTFAE